MGIIVEIITSAVLSFFVFVGFLSLIFSKHDNHGLVVGVVSFVSMVFGLFLSVKNSIIIDYKSAQKSTKPMHT